MNLIIKYGYYVSKILINCTHNLAIIDYDTSAIILLNKYFKDKIEIIMPW